MADVVIRLVLVRLPRLLADLVSNAFAGMDGLAVQAVDGSGTDLAGVVADTRPTVLITGVAGPAEAAEAAATVAAGHDLIVLGVSPDAREAWLYELRPVARPLGQLSPELLRRTVLDALQAKAS